MNQPLQLGGVKDTLPLRHMHSHYKGFVGCIRNLLVDTQVLRLFLLYKPCSISILFMLLNHIVSLSSEVFIAKKKILASREGKKSDKT